MDDADADAGGRSEAILCKRSRRRDRAVGPACCARASDMNTDTCDVLGTCVVA